ncbi:MAG: S8 family serine peptidase [Actinomycetota bacterium]|nr:S8 family serine peptidase [Actinomycetota bacterium]
MKKARVALSCLLACLLLQPVPALAASNDPLFRHLWGLQRVGAEQAWRVSRGAGVLIAVIDTGVDLSHPDLAGKVVPGASLVGEGTADDQHGHGTMVAGIAGARTGNGQGIASVAPDATILPLRVFDEQGISTSSRVAGAIRLARDEARRRGNKLVLNLSFVGPPRAPGEPVSRNAILGDRSVRTAISEAAADGAAVVAASGNDGSSETAFDAPSNVGIIVVGASDRGDRCASFTNYGPGLDILAPGVDILSTYWALNGNRSVYAYGDGTSLAVPFVAGAAALLMATGLTNVQAINRLLASARGPEVSCKGESSRYRHLDIAAALGTPRARNDPSFRSAATHPPIPPARLAPSGDQEPDILRAGEAPQIYGGGAGTPAGTSPPPEAMRVTRTERQDDARRIAMGMLVAMTALLLLEGRRRSRRRRRLGSD